MIIESTRCRICKNPNLVPLLNLGQQTLTGRFPKSASDPLTSGPLELVRCQGADCCGLVQLRHTFDLGEMYGESYGYRSSLNRSMVEHLRDVVQRLRARIEPAKDHLAIDIGSNDGTLLSFYPPNAATLVGIDPSAEPFRRYYRDDIHCIVDFFSASGVRERFGDRKADIITSIAMLYDLPDPQAFAADVASLLSDQGVWFFEQSYVLSMMEAGAYDTICHEHLEYYALAQIQWILQRTGLRIIDVSLNDTNGGSFAVTAAKIGSAHRPNQSAIDQLVAREREAKLDAPAAYQVFAQRAAQHREQLVALLRSLRDCGKRVLGYGASTKGNVMLQYCAITPELLPAIADVNAAKFGHVTPGTHIPIISEADAHAMKPDYFLVFPWHFRANLLKREANWLANGGKMIFPLPTIETVSA